MTTLLPTKFYLPPEPTGFVERPQLLEKLDGVLSHRLTLVSAPAGAGKSVLVSTWVQSARKKGVTFGWLSLDDADNDPEHFLEYLVASLEEGGVIMDAATFPSRQGEKIQAEEILTGFIRGLISFKLEIALVLDDYQLIHNQEVHTILEYLIDHSPPHLHIILLTRSDPPLELARLRVTGQLVEVRMEHLRFSTQETREFLKKAASVQLTESDVAALNERTEGWIAGLQMAAISLHGNEDTSAFVAAVKANRFPVLLTEQRDHLEALAELLSKRVAHVFVMKGGMGKKQLCQLAEQIANVLSNQPRVILATGRYLGEGFDDERLDTLFLALPISWRGTLTQYAGRLHRLNANKKEVVIYDFVDFDIPVLVKMFAKRRAGYKAIGYEIELPTASNKPAQLALVDL